MIIASITIQEPENLSGSNLTIPLYTPSICLFDKVGDKSLATLVESKSSYSHSDSKGWQEAKGEGFTRKKKAKTQSEKLKKIAMKELN